MCESKRHTNVNSIRCKVTDGTLDHEKQCKAVLTDCELMVDFDDHLLMVRVGFAPTISFHSPENCLTFLPHFFSTNAYQASCNSF